MILPPAVYDHDYPTPVIQYRERLAEVDARCRKNGAQSDGFIYGCAFKVADRCVIVIPVSDKTGGVGKWLADSIRRFEIAHCNGMPEDHARCALCRYLSRT